MVDKDGKLVSLITYKDITKAKDKPMTSANRWWRCAKRPFCDR